MSLTQRLKIRKPNRFSRVKPRGDIPSMLGDMAKNIANSRLEILERLLKKEVKKAIDDIDALIPRLKGKANKEIKDHITNRLVEIRGEDGYSPVKNKDYFDGEKGDRGEPGKEVIGPQGEKGKDGESIVGSTGKDGKDGSPDKPNEVVE